MSKKASRPPLEVNLEELDRIIDGGKQAPLSEADGEKLKTALHALAQRAAPRPRSTEKTNSVLPNGQPLPKSDKPAPPGHGRHGAAEFPGAQRVVTRHGTLQPGDGCPECRAGKVYGQKDPQVRIRIVGQVPLQATVYEMERLRCNGCGQVFTATAPPESNGPKYDPSAAAMIAQLRYGSGLPFQRLERLQGGAGHSAAGRHAVGSG
jgi:rubredoxin